MQQLVFGVMANFHRAKISVAMNLGHFHGMRPCAEGPFMVTMFLRNIFECSTPEHRIQAALSTDAKNHIVNWFAKLCSLPPYGNCSVKELLSPCRHAIILYTGLFLFMCATFSLKTMKNVFMCSCVFLR